MRELNSKETTEVTGGCTINIIVGSEVPVTIGIGDKFAALVQPLVNSLSTLLSGIASIFKKESR